MKTNSKIYIIIISTLFSLNACCSKEDLAGNDIEKFIFLDNNTGDNLLFGSFKSLNKDSLFISYNNNEYQNIPVSTNNQDSVVLINFNYADTCFIKFSNNDIDTFNLKYEKITGKTSYGNCKLSATTIKSITYNGISLSIDNSQNPITIYK